MNTTKYSAYVASGLSVSTIISGLESAVGILFAICTIISTGVTVVSLIVSVVKKIMMRIDRKEAITGDDVSEIAKTAHDIEDAVKTVPDQMNKIKEEVENLKKGG